MSERRRASAVLDNIEAKLLDHRRPSPFGRCNFDVRLEQQPDVAMGVLDAQTLYRTTLQVNYAQWVQRDGGDWKPYCDQVAKRAIARELYGGVVSRLRDILEHLQEEGVSPRSELYQQVCELIDELGGAE